MKKIQIQGRLTYKGELQQRETSRGIWKSIEFIISTCPGNSDAEEYLCTASNEVAENISTYQMNEVKQSVKTFVMKGEIGVEIFKSKKNPDQIIRKNVVNCWSLTAID